MEANPFLDNGPESYGASVEEASLIIYALHGRSQDAGFTKKTAQRLALEDTAWVMPKAPDKTWYPAGFMAPIDDNEPSLSHALEMVSAHLQTLANLNRPVVLFGFSQGACLLSEYLSQEPQSVAGAVLHTGGYIGQDDRETDPSTQSLTGQEVLMLTSSQDSWVPLHRAQLTAELFQAKGASVDLEVYDDPEHHVNDEAIARIQTFLRERYLIK